MPPSNHSLPPPIIFDGKRLAAARKLKLQRKVARLSAQHRSPQIASLLFSEDAGSILYTKLKARAAESIGIRFTAHTFSLRDPLADALARLHALNHDEGTTGIIVQKPTRRAWRQAYRGQRSFREWWQCLTAAIAVHKDVDCLTPANLSQIESGRWGILPATVKAALIACQEALALPLMRYGRAAPVLPQLPVAVIGCSDIIGQPLAHVLRHLGAAVTQYCYPYRNLRLQAAEIVISATGQPGLVTGEMIKRGAVIIDVGSPAGDVDFESAAPRAKFITPVPGGIGPLTVVSLLENAVALARTGATTSAAATAAPLP